MEDNNISLKEIWYSILKRWKLISSIVLGATLISGILSFFIIKPEYESTAKLFIGKQELSSEGVAYDNNDVTMYQKLMKTYAEVLKTSDLVESSLKSVGINYDEEEIENILNNLEVEPSSDTQILEVTYRDKNPEQTLKITNAITTQFIKESIELISNGNVKIIQTPKLPKEPVSPNKVKNIAIAFMGGIVASIGLVFLLEYLEGTFKSREEVERISKLPIIGTIPDFDDI